MGGIITHNKKYPNEYENPDDYSRPVGDHSYVFNLDLEKTKNNDPDFDEMHLWSLFD